MVFFISDTHFGHDNIIKGCNRPYHNVEEMNIDLIKRWNNKVGENDCVYILGDMFRRCKNPEYILLQLNGEKHLILGNHDNEWLGEIEMEKYFKTVNSLLEISFDSFQAILCHYPLVTWKHPKDTYMIHGHIHNDTDSEYWQFLRSNPRILNAGVEINGYEPVTLEELIRNNEEFKRKHKRG